jgi:hypothetical protein
VARWDCGAKWAEGPAPQAQCATPLGLTLSEGLGRTSRALGRLIAAQNLRSLFLLLPRSEVRAQLDAVRPVIATAAVLGRTGDCWPAATPRTRKNAAGSGAC